MTLQDATSNPTSDDRWARGNDEHIMAPPSVKLPKFTSSTFLPAQTTLGAAAHENDDFAVLFSLDHELYTRATRALELVNDLDAQGAQSRVLNNMEGEELWLEEVQKKLETIGIMGDECNEMLRVAMLEKVDQILAAIKSVRTTLASRTSEDPSLQDHASVVVETGMWRASDELETD
jgi:hypothetical protein